MIKKHITKILITIGLLGVASAAVLPEQVPDKVYTVVNWERPATDMEWAEDVKNENFNVKHYYQLEQMEENLTEKLPKVQKDLDKFNDCPECIKWELREQLSEDFPKKKDLDKAVEKEYQDQLHYYKWKTDKISQSVERLKKEKKLRDDLFIDRTDEIIGTTYYIDCTNGSSTSIGTASSTAGANLDQFTEVARSAGDKVIVRRGQTGCDDGTDLLFTSDGTITSPIVIEADYDNIWGDRVDLSSTGSATLTFGSKTITFSADISGVLSVGDWIYASGDISKDFAYEVASVSTVTVTLYLPYKGDQTGSGKTMYNMQAAPIWNTTVGDFRWNIDGDYYWKVQGLHIKGTDSSGNVEIDSCAGHIFKDVIFEGNDSSDYGIRISDEKGRVIVRKSRFYNYYAGIFHDNNVGTSYGHAYDSLFDTGNRGIGTYNTGWFFYDCEFANHSYTSFSGTFGGTTIYHWRNNLFQATSPITDDDYHTFFFSEDHNQIIGDNRQLGSWDTADGVPILQSSTSTVRSGGGNTSVKIRPSAELSSTWELSNFKLFEYPIYADTTSKTYTVYFASASTTAWTDNPTASELWIECEYWGHASNNHRKITKSTDTVDFKTDTNFNQTIAVTCQPSQTGVMYLRGYYAKTKEAGDNIFYVDVAPVIN